MKNLLILCLLSLALLLNSGCPANTVPPTPNASTQGIAEQSLYAIGVTLQAVPGVCNALYDAGKLSKAEYNNAVTIYNRAAASYKLAVEALSVAVTAGADPATAPAYVAALNSFLADKSKVDTLLIALGGAK